MTRILKSLIAGFILGTIALLLALGIGWGAHATTAIGQTLSVVFGWPFILTRGIHQQPGSDISFILAVAINYGFYILLAWLFLYFRNKRQSPAA